LINKSSAAAIDHYTRLEAVFARDLPVVGLELCAPWTRHVRDMCC